MYFVGLMGGIDKLFMLTGTHEQIHYMYLFASCTYAM